MKEDSLIEARRDYTADTLSRSELAPQPVAQFTEWLADARAKNILDATAMMLATADASGQPHARIVLLKHFDAAGFVWYTFQESDKAREIAANPRASILFYWCALERQVRIEGSVERLDPGMADEYFHSRPEGSRFSAAVSRQSAPVENRAVLEQRVAELHDRYPDGDVPRPPQWGGYRLRPERFEFWQGRADRLHDRFVYVMEKGPGMSPETSPEIGPELSPTMDPDIGPEIGPDMSRDSSAEKVAENGPGMRPDMSRDSGAEKVAENGPDNVIERDDAEADGASWSIQRIQP